jgi:hypothetical protein
LPQAVDLRVSDVVVLIDREQGGASRLAADNLNLHAAFPLSYILEVRRLPAALRWHWVLRLKWLGVRPCLPFGQGRPDQHCHYNGG